jgi:hypothetical protein
MKLTQEKLIQLIEQEIKSANENPMQPATAEQPGAAENPEDNKEKALNLTSLGDEMIETGRAIKASKFKGLDTNEIKLVSAVLANVLQLASSKPAGTLLKRINDLIEKNK